MSKAASLADKLKKLPNIQQAELIPSGGGAFEVKVDGKLIFSKLQAGRFPEVGEIESKLAEFEN